MGVEAVVDVHGWKGQKTTATRWSDTPTQTHVQLLSLSLTCVSPSLFLSTSTTDEVVTGIVFRWWWRNPGVQRMERWSEVVAAGGGI